MKILVIGSGGREHALVWKLKQSPRVRELYCAPGNAGIAGLATCVPIPATDVAALVAFAKEHRIDLTVVGSEQPLVLGIVDTFKRSGLKVFGPTREASILEASKVFSKQFCLHHNIPTAEARTFDNADQALAFVATEHRPLVIKADGLCAGKGVIVCSTRDEAREAVRRMMIDCEFGDAGARIVIEERLEGEEVSFLAISDGNHVLPLASSEDHKRIFDDDQGPNTGGMGAYSPAPIITNGVYEAVMERVMLPTVRGMVMEGRAFTGVLYAGLMMCKGEPKVLEFNVRFGDPETQPLLMRLKTDLVDVMTASIAGTLDRIQLEWDPRPAVCVVMAAGGYPGSYEKGKVIRGLDQTAELSDAMIFHAGTVLQGNDIVTNGGRVLGVTALGSDIAQAIERTYGIVEKISWDGCHYRKDIGRRALARGT